MLVFFRKNKNLIFRLCFLFVLIIALFLSIKQRGFARAGDQNEQTNQINIFPESYFIEEKEEGDLKWLNGGGSLAPDLDETAGLEEFNKNNSAYIAAGAKEEVGANNNLLQSQGDANWPSGDNSPAGGETENLPKEENNESSEGGKTIASSSAKLENSLFRQLKNFVFSLDEGFRYLKISLAAFFSKDEAKAEDDISTSTDTSTASSTAKNNQSSEEGAGESDNKNVEDINSENTNSTLDEQKNENNNEEYTIILKDFSLPSDFQIGNIKNAQLRMSLTGFSAAADDKILISYNSAAGWEEVGALNIGEAVSNKTNKGYFLYGLPIFSSPRDLDELEIKVSYLSYSELKEASVFLDAVWLEVDYAATNENEKNEEPVDEKDGQAENEEFILDLISAKKDFKSTENPDFNFKYQRKRGAVNELFSKVIGVFWDEYKDIGIEVKVKGADGKEIDDVGYEAKYLVNGEFFVRLKADPRYFRPGKLSLEISIKDGDKVYTQSQDFDWGVLAINANKSIYAPTETAYLQMAVLDDSGSTICDTDLFLEITAPDGGIAYLNSGNGLIIRSGQCGPNNIVSVPDYYAYYGLAGVGAYNIKLTAKTADGEKIIYDHFEVRDNISFDIERIGPTRIFPLANYQMAVKIKNNSDGASEIIEWVPDNFEIVGSEVYKNKVQLAESADYNFEIKSENGEKILKWNNLNFKNAEELEIVYKFDAPNVSPEFYLLGPLKISSFEEARQWQIAADAVNVYDANAGYGINWNTAANAWNSVNNNYAWRTIPANGANDSANYLKATGNTATDLGGTITQVRIGIEGYVTNTNVAAYLGPVFGATATGTAQVISGATLGTSDSGNTFYVDITNDALAPASWAWSDIINLDVIVYGNNTFTAGRRLYVDQIRLEVTYTPPNAMPAGSFVSMAQKIDGTGVVDIAIAVADSNGDNSRAKLEYVAGSDCNFLTPIDPTFEEADASTTALFGDPDIDNNYSYQVGTTTGWIITSSGENTVNFDWNSKADLPAGDGVYCLRLTANDGTVDQAVSATATTTIDNINPDAPGQMSAASSASTETILTFGSASDDTNFKEYKIFYKQGSSGVTEADTEFNQSDDPNLGYIDYNGAASTTITGLSPETQYVFNIWAYDDFGNKASSTEITFTTSEAEPLRANSVMFLAGTYTGNGSAGQNSDTNQILPSFNFSLAETGAEIKNAYIIFEAQFESYANNAGSYTGYELAFDACEEPCTANAFSGTGAVSKNDTTILAYDGAESNEVRLLLDVTNETQLAAYSGSQSNLQGQVGYNIKRGTAINSISAVKAVLVVTYIYNENNIDSFTNTVVYPLESAVSGDSGSRLASQANNCTLDSNCPKFNYNVQIPELSENLSQWFQTYNVNDGHGAIDISINVNIEGTNIDSATYFHETANAGTQGNTPIIYFNPVNGFSENTGQQLEYRAAATGGTYYLLGGETMETYTASSTAPVKTKTVSFPIGAINNGLTAAKTNGSVNIYFPENGAASGVVSIKKAWVRILTNNYNTGANTITVSSKVGANNESSSFVYNYDTGPTVIKPSFNIIHVVPSSDYPELEAANAASPKTVIIYTQNSNSTSQGGTSAELMITYTYTSEASGHLTSLNLFAGQTNVNGNSQNSTTTVANSVLPELVGSKTILAGSLLGSYLISDSDGAVNAANLTLDANLSTGAPNCSNVYNSRPDAVNSFTEFYKNIASVLTTADNQAYTACYSNDGAGDSSGGAKMNGSLIYTYKWDAPPVEYEGDNWRWYDNADSLSPGVAKADEKTAIVNINIADILRLRMNVKVTAENLATSSQTFKLQYGEGSDCSAVASWFDAGDVASSSIWRGYNNFSVADGASTTSPLLSTSNKFQTYEEENFSAANSQNLLEGEYGEWDWVIYNNGATSSTDYCFRMVKNSGAVLENYVSYPKATTAPANTIPNNPSGLKQYKNDGLTLIANGEWIKENEVLLVAGATDPNVNEIITLYYELIPDGSSFTTSTTPPPSSCVPGTPYGSCAPKIWSATSPSGDYRTSPYIATTSIPSIPEAFAGYKWQILACDDSGVCSSVWIKPGTNPNFKVDLTAPVPAGALTENGKTATSITLVFGAQASETNFSQYKIFYKTGTSGVSESDNEHTDSNLDYINYNSATSTIVNNLTAGTQYIFNIWAYDLAGNKASSTAELTTTTSSSFTPPTGSFNTVAQKTDGSGGIDIAIAVDDPDNDDTLRAKLEYEAGSNCAFSPSLDPTIDETGDNITAVYGDPAAENDNSYQVGTSDGWIITSPGENYVFFDWLSKSDVSAANGTYCLRLTVNDGIFDQAVSDTKLIIVDNTAPTVPGALDLSSKNSSSVTLNFGAQSSDTRFDKYRIFYATSSPAAESDTEHIDSNLNYVNYNGAASTTISELTPDTQYYFNIWAYDDFGNNASSTEIAVKTNAFPLNASAAGQFKVDEITTITNGGWTTQNEVRLTAGANDPDTSEILTLYFEFIPNASSFKTATTVPANACAYGTAYGSCASKVWFVASSSPGNYAVNPFVATTSITAIPDSSTGYKWQVLACDDDGDCSEWDQFNITVPNIKIDTVSPTAAGALSYSTKTSTSATLSFGSQTSETNFSQYKIFYGTSTPLTINDDEHIDSNLNYINYNGATLTTISGLQPDTQYYFNIWAYDQAGQSASSTETAVTTNQVQSTPGVFFYAKNTRVLYYKVWTGSGWGSEQSGPTLGSAAGDNIRHISSIRSDDGGKVAVLVKTWDGTNQEWWATVYRVAANNFVNSSQLGATLASATNAQIITGCLAALSGGEFFIVRNNNAANGTLIYSWDATGGWTAEGAGPNPVAVLNGCYLTRRPNSDNYLLMTFDNAADVGSSYYYGGSTYANSWTTWTEHSTSEEGTAYYVGEAFFDTGDNGRGAFYYSNSAVNWYAFAKRFTSDGSSVTYGSASSSPQTAPDSWADDFVHGEFSADPGAIGIAYFAGDDIIRQLNVYKVDITSSQPTWSTVTNGDNISGGALYSYANGSQKPYSIAFYKGNKAVVAWNENTSQTPKYRKLDASLNSMDSSNAAVPGAGADIWTRVRTYDDPNEDELLAVYQNDNIDYAAVFWSGAGEQFFSSGSQGWTALATATGAFSANDECVSFSFTAGNSAPNTPSSLGQFKSDAATPISNNSWTNESEVYIEASATDPDTSEVITLYTELIGNAGVFTTATDEPTGACVWGTAYGDCASKIWFVASSSPGDYSAAPFTDAVNITGIPDSASGYKWQVIACDDSGDCSNWVQYNAAQPNFKVDITAPTAPGALSLSSKTSASITLSFGAQTFENNFYRYRIFYKQGASGVMESDTEHSDADLNFINYNGTSNTTISGLASSTQYVFNIWAYDLTGNKATSTAEIAVTTNAGPSLNQTSYLLENDDGADVNSNTAEVGADISLSNIIKGERLNARIQIENSGGDTAANKVYKLQYENQTDSPGTWVDVGASTEVSYALGLSGVNGDAITSRKAAMNSKTWANGSWHENTSSANSYSLINNYFTEFIFAVKTSNAVLGKTYRLRLYNATDSSLLNSYVNYPTFSMAAAETKKYSKGTYAGLPVSSADLAYYLDPQGYADALSDNGARDSISSQNNYPVVNFVMKNATNTEAITAIWNGQSSAAPSSLSVVLQVYRFGATNAWQTVATNNTASADSDFDLTGNINARVSEYYDGSFRTYWRVYQNSGSQTLRSDYFNLIFSAPVEEVKQEHYRWRADDGSQTTANWKESEDTGSPTASSSLSKSVNARLRFSAANAGGGTASNYAYRLEYASTATNCSTDPGGWTAVPTDSSLAFRMGVSSNFSNGDSTTAQFANSEGYTFISGRMVEDPSNATAGITLAENNYSELEYVFYATTNATDGGTYCFRVTNAGAALDAYDIYAEITLAGNSNTAPSFTINPSDNGSAVSAPTNYGSNVVFTATAGDAENDDYYLAVCQTNSITPGNNNPPTCNGGAWCISSLASSTAEATCNYATASASETLSWYGFVCDKKAGAGVAKCSLASQGGWGDDNDSPFNINHAPTFTSVSTTENNKDPGGAFTVSTASGDTDTAGGVDTLYLYVCRTNSASFLGCTGGAGDTVCQTTATSSPNAKCYYNDVAPTPAGAYIYYAFIYDNHGLAASANSRSNTYTINNLAPVLGTLTLNSGSNITLNMKGAPDAQIQTINTSVTDLNGCATGLMSATAAIYMSNVSGGPNCTANDNDCYQINTSNCVKSACAGDDDSTATYTCAASLKYYAVPTDNSGGNPWEPYNWLSNLRVYDGLNYAATTSVAVELVTSQALDVFEDVIDFGSDLLAGQNSGTTNQPTKVVNAGNSPLDTNLSGNDMTGNPSGTITVGNLRWDLTSGFNWTSGVSLTSGGQDVNTVMPKATSSAEIFDMVYWGIGIPFGSSPAVYTGQNIFSAVLDYDGW